jgi:hypothetical protein
VTDRDPTPLNAVWAGQTVYRCRLCDYDTLEETKFVYHFATVHPPLEILDGGEAEAPAPANERMSREELEEIARKLGVESPANFPNKTDLVEAIVAVDQTGDADAPGNAHED